MLSTSIFSQNGSIYDQAAVFGSTFQLNETALQEVGLPALTGSNAWSNLMSNLAVSRKLRFDELCSFMKIQIGGLVAHVLLFWGPYAVESFKLAYSREQPDPHYQVLPCPGCFSGLDLTLTLQAMKKYKEAPWWWYVLLLFLSFFAGTSQSKFVP